MKHSSALFLACLFVAGLTAGCGGGGPELIEVTGTITLNGAPLADAEVVFQPEGGRPSGGRTDAEGRYELRFNEDESGALAGVHRVMISTFVERDADASDPIVQTGRAELVPPEFSSSSTLTVTVDPNTDNVFDFAIPAARVVTRN